MEIIANGIKFYLMGGKAYVMNNHYHGDVIIPSHIPDNNGGVIPVAGIDIRAFCNCAGLTSVVLPEGLQSIAAFAFMGCTSLRSIVIPDSVTHIDACAFEYCNQLERVVLPKGLTYLPERCFCCCEALSDITLPDTLELVGEYALHLTAWMKQQPDGIVYAGDILYGHRWDTYSERTLQVKDDTRVIGEGAMEGNQTLTHLILPSSVRQIGANAFRECKHLKTVELAEGLEVIGDNAFEHCEDLEAVYIPASVRYIGAEAFAHCKRLREIVVAADNPYLDSRGDCNAVIDSRKNKLIVGCSTTVIPDDVEVIGDYAMVGVYAAEEWVIPRNIKCVGYYAFAENMSLRRLVVHDRMELISGWAFFCCENLQEIVLPDSYIEFGEQAFGGTDLYDSTTSGTACVGNHLHAYYAQDEGEKVQECIIPEGIEAIDDKAFDFAPNGLRIFLPKSLRYVSNAAFIPSEAEYELIVPEGVGEDYPYYDIDNPQYAPDIYSKWMDILDDEGGR